MDEEEAIEDALPSSGEDSIDPPLSYNSLKGSQGVQTMRFVGILNGMQIQILLDSGSSDNFLQPKIANYLKLPITPAPNFLVLVRNGHSLVAEGKIQKLEVSIQGYTLHLPVYILPIFGADLVLGVSWLATLGAHISDYNTLQSKFYLDNQFITLQGEKTQLPHPAQFNQLCRLHHTHAIEQVFTLQQLQSQPVSESSLPTPQNRHVQLIPIEQK